MTFIIVANKLSAQVYASEAFLKSQARISQYDWKIKGIAVTANGDCYCFCSVNYEGVQSPQERVGSSAREQFLTYLR